MRAQNDDVVDVMGRKSREGVAGPLRLCNSALWITKDWGCDEPSRDLRKWREGTGFCRARKPQSKERLRESISAGFPPRLHIRVTVTHTSLEYFLAPL